MGELSNHINGEGLLHGQIILQAETIMGMLEELFGAKVALSDYPELFKLVEVKKIRGMQGTNYQMCVVDLVGLRKLLKNS